MPRNISLSLRKGDSGSRDQWVAKYPELAPHLESRLKLYEAVLKATRLSGMKSSSGGQEPDSNEPTDLSFEHHESQIETQATPRASFPADRTIRIRCPHCGNHVQLVGQQIQEVTCNSCGSAVRVDLEGTLTDLPRKLPETLGRFKIVRMLGEGAFGTVLLAFDPELERQVALKLPRYGFFSSPDDEQRFYREAKSASQLQHHGIVRIHEITQVNDLPLIVSEYVAGLTLGDIVSGNVLTFRESVELMIQICSAVEHAHQHGVIHRDLKPSNILVTDDRRAYITDFGLARRDDLEITMTLDGTILGTPAYMSPEQALARHEDVGPRSDVYSLGVILYRMLCRELPFHGTKRMLLQQVIHDEPISPRRLNDVVPRDLETITLKAMAKSPDERFSTADEMQAELQRWLDGKPIQSRPISQLTRLARWCQRHRAVAALASAIGILLLIRALLGVIWGFRESSLRTLADQNADAAEQNRLESDSRLYQTQMLNGNNALEKNDLGRSLYWFSNALALQDTRNNRVRIGMIQDRLPKLTNLWDLESEIQMVRTNQTGTRLAASARSGRISVFDRRSRATLLNLQTDGPPLTAFGFSPTGTRIVVQSQPDFLQLWDVDSNQLVKSLQHDGLVTDCNFDSRGEQIISASADSLARIWSAADGNKKHEIEITGTRLLSAQFIANRELALLLSNRELAREHEVRIWDYANDRFLGQPISFPQQVTSIDVSTDGKRFVAASGDRSLQVREIDTGELVGPAISLYETAGHVFFVDQGRAICAVDVTGQVSNWDFSTGLRVGSNFHSPIDLTVATRNPSGQLLALGGTDGTTRFVWRASGTEASSLVHNAERVTEIEFFSDGHSVAIGGSDGILQIWDLAGSHPTAHVFQHEGKVRNALFIPNGTRCVSVGLDGTGYLWDTASGEKIGQPLRHDAGIYECATDPGGRMVATAGGDATAKVWDSFTGQQIGPALPHETSVLCVAFDPTRDRLVTGCRDGTVSCWQLGSDPAAEPKPLFSNQQAEKIRRVSYRSSGDLIASASMDGTVRIWDANTGLPKAGPFEHPEFASYCEFLPHANQLITCGSNGEARIWDLANGQLVQVLPCLEKCSALRFPTMAAS